MRMQWKSRGICTLLCSAISKQHKLSINNQNSNHQHEEKHYFLFLMCFLLRLKSGHYFWSVLLPSDPQISQGLWRVISTSVEHAV